MGFVVNVLRLVLVLNGLVDVALPFLSYNDPSIPKMMVAGLKGTTFSLGSRLLMYFVASLGVMRLSAGGE